MRKIAFVLLIALAGCRGRRPVSVPAPLAPDSGVAVWASGESVARRAVTDGVGIPAESRSADRLLDGNVRDDGALREINRFLEDAFFDFDRYQLRNDAMESLRKNAGKLKVILEGQAGLMLIVEGHCDELGSAEYNLGLGERRAEVARDFLVQLGIPGERLRTVTWGKERPLCTEATEGCRQRNRRAHVIYSE